MCPGAARRPESSAPGGAPLSDLVARDAREFGVYARTGGWAFAPMVARSVRPGGQAADGTPTVSARPATSYGPTI